jgi:putative DNA methylase
LVQAGILEARAGKVRIFARGELPADWDPLQDKRVTTWEATHYLIRALDKGGEKEAAALLARLGSYGEAVRDLAYRLYTICERKKWAQEAMACNMLVIAMPRLRDQEYKKTESAQQTLF